ncbi:tropinone reductase homolog At2g29290-like isoform X1 [Malus domestica]|uniref:tropinone reductase homolog At2g29290-like isoform X1 n=1 Tax=Malus domestica TaxID=3750 RepID=UPI0007EC717F|nr:tropinone reductase homolog At2g29290-like isoform X1 [Malus domestica]
MAGFDSQRWSLKGMTALVTGGTKGIGYAIVEELAGLGATVHTCARNQAQILERLQEWESKGFKVTGSVCDLTSKAQRENLIKTVSSIFEGKLNILVNSAATCTLRGTTDYTLEDFSSMMKTNVESPYHLSQLAHPLLKASGNASIVFVASIAGVVALPKLSAYAATKMLLIATSKHHYHCYLIGAVIQISKNLACEWAKDNIRTNAVAPWAVNTGVKVESDGHSDDFRRLIGRTPIQRLAQPNEISSLITFLCLPAASYINGQVISVDGGFTVSGF